MTEQRSELAEKYHPVRNLDKFESTNKVAAGLVARFMRRCSTRVGLLAAPGATILDCGAGEGTMTSYLAEQLPANEVQALEYVPEAVRDLRDLYPAIRVTEGSVYELPWPDDSFDVLTCFEVMEHLDYPQKALAEMHRVARRHVVVTVPFEPWYRAGNVARGRYISSFGNTPGHINHWSQRSLASLFSREFDRYEVAPLFPWLLATAAAGPR